MADYFDDYYPEPPDHELEPSPEDKLEYYRDEMMKDNGCDNT